MMRSPPVPAAVAEQSKYGARRGAPHLPQRSLKGLWELTV